MKSFIKSILILIGTFSLNGCCEVFDETFCVDQVFTEVVTVPLNFTYSVNTDKPFVESRKLTAANVKNALKVEGSDFKVKKVDVISGSLNYTKDPANVSKTMMVNIGIKNSTGGVEQSLLKENKELSLTDVAVLGVKIPINAFLNSVGISELKTIIKDYATTVNTGEISFNLKGEGLPSGSLLKFNLTFEFKLSVEYEVCRYAPMGEGERVCPD